MSRLVFSKERAEEFWTELQDLMARYPETTAGLRTCYEDQDEEDEYVSDRIALIGEFDPESPVLLQGIVLMAVVRNMQGYETMFTVSPPEQSAYLTDGMIVNVYQDI